LKHKLHDRPVVAEAEVVKHIHPPHKFHALPHLLRKDLKTAFPRTEAPQSHVFIKPGRRMQVFESNNRGPIIKGEREERRRRYQREKREAERRRRRWLIRQAERRFNPQKKEKFASPEYYPKHRKHHRFPARIAMIEETVAIAADEAAAEEATLPSDDDAVADVLASSVDALEAHVDETILLQEQEELQNEHDEAERAIDEVEHDSDLDADIESDIEAELAGLNDSEADTESTTEHESQSNAELADHEAATPEENY